jgi:hypothetical protein
MVEKDVKVLAESHDGHSDADSSQDWTEAEEKALVRK